MRRRRVRRRPARAAADRRRSRPTLTLFRVFLIDGASTLCQLRWEIALVGERVVFSMPAVTPGPNPALAARDGPVRQRGRVGGT